MPYELMNFHSICSKLGFAIQQFCYPNGCNVGHRGYKSKYNAAFSPWFEELWGPMRSKDTRVPFRLTTNRGSFTNMMIARAHMLYRLFRFTSRRTLVGRKISYNFSRLINRKREEKHKGIPGIPAC
ncbi:uncharacterized protein Dwil_GK27890 [Drosophila willistoni]|uniref:Uncharacterized protein n=1 Tax=Drosophila willistoni TaxID=7260 RepID=A0A0Q9X3Z7_DROWI|nr:uncharacterized protein LOC26529892 [Drosophila willistoni]KRF99677.1 uncharacterized protein Dwil_GK27890 [Drosophila willistoni]